MAERPPSRSRARRGELISAAAALVLLGLMFGAAWYGIDGIPGRSQIATVENAWHALTLTRWLMLLTIGVTIAALLGRLSGRDRLRGMPGPSLVAGLGVVTGLVLTYRVLINLPDPPAVVDQKLGAYLGLLSAFLVALGGYDALRAGRLELARRRTMTRRLRPR